MFIVRIMLTSGQRFLSKGGIASALVTPVVDKSILKLHFCCDVMSFADKSAAPCCCNVCCLPSLIHFNQGNNPQNCRLLPASSWFLGPIQVHNPKGISVSSSVFVVLTVVTNRETDHTITVAIGCPLHVIQPNNGAIV